MTKQLSILIKLSYIRLSWSVKWNKSGVLLKPFKHKGNIGKVISISRYESCVIVGSSFAGLATAKTSKELNPSINVTVVDYQERQPAQDVYFMSVCHLKLS